LQLNLYQSSKMQIGHSMAMSELRGLDAQSVHGTNAPVKFALLRDAGTVQFEGTFDRDLGHGTFTFTAKSRISVGDEADGLRGCGRQGF
jgi:hypothetical protein